MNERHHFTVCFNGSEDDQADVYVNADLLAFFRAELSGDSRARFHRLENKKGDEVWINFENVTMVIYKGVEAGGAA
jgi:hypothetical protein